MLASTHPHSELASAISTTGGGESLPPPGVVAAEASWGGGFQLVATLPAALLQQGLGEYGGEGAPPCLSRGTWPPYVLQYNSAVAPVLAQEALMYSPPFR